MIQSANEANTMCRGVVVVVKRGLLAESDSSWHSAEDNPNQLELLATEEDGTDDNTVGSTSATSATPAISTRGRPLERTQLYDPESSPRKKSVPRRRGLP